MLPGVFEFIFLLVYLGFFVLAIAGVWITFEKAGQPGWGAIIPIYNLLVMIRVAGKPEWWIVLWFIPIANLIATILVSISVATRFGKGEGFGLGLAFLPFIFYPILGFGGAMYMADTEDDWGKKANPKKW